jgi:hypothetical protein
VIYRQLGKTGIKVSEISLGCEHLDRKPYEKADETINAALSHGVNLLDVFMPGTEIRTNIAKVLGNRRKDVYIQGHIGASDVNQQYDISRDMPVVKKYFEELLRLFGGYIDFGMLFFIDSEDDYKNVFDTEFVTYAERLKRDGYIGHIGFSSHNPNTAMKVIETGVVETMLFSINPAFDMLPSDKYVFDPYEVSDLHGIDPKRAALYTLCEQKGVGITVMKAFGGGKLLTESTFGKPMTETQCVHYALTRPAVASVMPGCQTADEMHRVMKYYEATEAEKDFSWVISSGKNDFMGRCVYCWHCQPCPVNIKIADVHKHLDGIRADIDNINACTECGSCEAKCPFGVPIINNIKKAQNNK